ncbi:hypothetical protein Aperf_G00000018346 [Anoplocephala perfoliata]
MVDFRQDRSKGSRADSMVILEDFSDRLNSVYTSLILLLLATITMANVYFVRPISCSIPTLPKDDFAGYAESVCWSQGTMSLDGGGEEDGPQRRAGISFSQWMPFCLSVQAVLFYLPHLIWRALLNSSFGDNLGYLVTRAKTAAVTDDAISRARLVRACADHLYLLSRQHFNTSTNAWSRFQERLSSKPICGRPCYVGRRMSNHSAVYYILVKIIYVANCIGQIFLAASFLGRGMSTLSILTGFSERLSGGHEYESKYFPRTGKCIFRVPSLGVQSQIYTVTCALPANVLNENIYLFLWIWILAVLAVSVISTLAWIRRLLMRAHSNSFLRSYLYISLLAPPYIKTSESVELSGDAIFGSGAYQVASLDGKLVERFLTEVVGCDGNFLIRVLRLNAGSIAAGEVLTTWWRLFRAMESAEDEDEILEFRPAHARTIAEMNEPDSEGRMASKTATYI